MVNRVLFGKRGTNDFGLWISKPGFNVLSANDDQLLFSSAWSTLQVVQAGSVAVSDNDPTTVAIPNLGYKPTVILIPEVQFSSIFSATDARMYAWATFSSNTSMTIHVDVDAALNYTGFTVYGIFRRNAASG